MAEITAYLSPNGENFSVAEGPATCLKVATVGGVATLRRKSPDAPWTHEGTTLAERPSFCKSCFRGSKSWR